MRSPRTASQASPGTRPSGVCRRSLPVGGHGTGRLPLVDFDSAYAQGFARVAACTLHTVIADPHANAEAVLEQARGCHDDGIAVAIFPELCLTGYAIDDLLLQETLLDAVEAAIAEIVAASVDLMTVLVVGAPLRKGSRLYNCAVVIHRGKVLGVTPKSYAADLPRVLRAPALRLGGRPARHRGAAGWRGGPVRGRPAVPRRRRARARAARRDLRGHVGARAAERRTPRSSGATVLANISGSPDHGRPGRGPPAAGPLRVDALPGGVPVRRGGAGGVQHRPVLGRPDDGLRGRRPARGVRALPRRPAAYDGRRRPRPGSGRSGCGRAPSTTTGTRSGPTGTTSHRRRVHPRPAGRRHRPAAPGGPVPVRPGRRRAARPGLLRGLQHPGVRARAAAAPRSASPRSSSASPAAWTPRTR